MSRDDQNDQSQKRYRTVKRIPQHSRRLSPRPRYDRGKRLSADDLRRARQAQPPAPPPSPVLARPAAGGRPPGPPRNPVPVAQAAAGEPPRRRWSTRRLTFVGVPLLVLVVVAAFAIPMILRARGAIDKIFVTPMPRPRVVQNAQGTPVIVPDATETVALPDWGKKERVNILLLGVDNRNDGEVPRSDTMIVVSIDPATKQVGMLSIPRDLLVSIPDVGEDKINAAYPTGEMNGVGGAALARATVEYNFGVPIHYVAEVDFTGFQKIVDTMGGVTLDVPAPIKDDQYPGEQSNYMRIYFHTGLQHLNGAQALHYVRTRHDDNDFARGQRQQQLLMALRQQGVSLNLITKAPQLADDLANTVRTDLAPSDVLALAKLATQIHGENIHSYSLLEATTSQWSPGEPYYLIPDWDKIHQILAEMMPPRPQAGGDDGAPKPDTAARVLVHNATYTDKLATHAAERLQAAGFTDVTPAQSPETGNHPTSQIVVYNGSQATARLIAQTLGLPESAIVEGDPAQANGDDILVILGDDAPALAGT